MVFYGTGVRWIRRMEAGILRGWACCGTGHCVVARLGTWLIGVPYARGARVGGWAQPGQSFCLLHVAYRT